MGLVVWKEESKIGYSIKFCCIFLMLGNGWGKGFYILGCWWIVGKYIICLSFFVLRVLGDLVRFLSRVYDVVIYIFLVFSL